MEMELNRVCIQIVASVSGSRCFCLLSTSYEIRSERKMCAHSTQVLVHRSMNYTFDWVNNQIQCKTRFTFFFSSRTHSLFLSPLSFNRKYIQIAFASCVSFFTKCESLIRFQRFFRCTEAIVDKVFMYTQECDRKFLCGTNSWCNLKQSLCVHFIVSF